MDKKGQKQTSLKKLELRLKITYSQEKFLTLCVIRHAYNTNKVVTQLIAFKKLLKQYILFKI